MLIRSLNSSNLSPALFSILHRPRHVIHARRLAIITASLPQTLRTFRHQHIKRTMATTNTLAISREALTSNGTPNSTSHSHSHPTSTSTTNNWTNPGPAAFDFRSDVVTTPTSSMLEAIKSTTLLDDVFVEDPTTNSLESFIAELTGHESALLVTSGTMGNQISLRTHLGGPPHSILTDARSHIMGWEAGGLASLSGALVNIIHPGNGHHVTLQDVKKHAVISDDVHSCPTRIISLENTLNGTVLPLDECQRIAQWARSQDPPILMHLDGARLWEAVAADHGSLKDYSACFDSISLCFSKGLGAPIGSIIVGSKKFIKRARWVRKSIGGGMRQAGVVTAPARVAVEETFLGGRLKASHDCARTIADLWISMGGKNTQPLETNMVWLDLEDAGIEVDKFIELGLKHGVKVLGGRLVVHYQIGTEAVERLRGLMQEILKDKKKAGTTHGQHTNGVDASVAEEVDKVKINVE